MNCRLLILILYFNPLITCGQQQPYKYSIEAKYKMIWQRDSTDTKSRNSELMSLLIGNEQSVFCATQYLVMDSAIAAEQKRGNKLGPSFAFFEEHGTRNHLVIFKNKDNIFVYDQIANFIPTIFQYTEKRHLLDWNIKGDTATIAGVHCQKATTIFGNRIWEAWFAPSIAVADGPYKFCGLPGLILKINDVKDYWSFEIVGLMETDAVLNITFLNYPVEKMKDKNTFLLQKQESRDNNFQIRKLRGTRFSDDALAKKMYENAARADNNWIELYKGN